MNNVDDETRSIAEQRASVIASMLSSIQNAKKTFGESSNQYLHLKHMVEEAVRQLRESGEEDEAERLLGQLALT